MRRSDREIRDYAEILSVMRACDVVRLAFNDEEVPYILPLNFGMKVEGGEITLYFHGATEGKKYELLAKDNRVAFEMDCGHELFGNGATCSMAYESVIGRGRIELVDDPEEAHEGLRILLNQYGRESLPVNDQTALVTRVMKLCVETLTAKRRPVKR